jgi:hypothetical protein
MFKFQIVRLAIGAATETFLTNHVMMKAFQVALVQWVKIVDFMEIGMTTIGKQTTFIHISYTSVFMTIFLLLFRERYNNYNRGAGQRGGGASSGAYEERRTSESMATLSLEGN